MLRAFRIFFLSLAMAFAPIAQASADNTGTSEGSSASGGSDAASTNSESSGSTDAQSTGEFFASPAVTTEEGLASSSDWTTMTLTEAATQAGIIIAVILVVIVILAALGYGIYLTVRAQAAKETALNRFVRYNGRALREQVVAGHGPVLVDYARLYGIADAYAPFAAALARDQATMRDLIASEAPAAKLASHTVTVAMHESDVLAEWYSRGMLGLVLRPLRRHHD